MTCSLVSLPSNKFYKLRCKHVCEYKVCVLGLKTKPLACISCVCVCVCVVLLVLIVFRAACDCRRKPTECLIQDDQQAGQSPCAGNRQIRRESGHENVINMHVRLHSYMCLCKCLGLHSNISLGRGGAAGACLIMCCRRSVQEAACCALWATKLGHRSRITMQLTAALYTSPHFSTPSQYSNCVCQ